MKKAVLLFLLTLVVGCGPIVRHEFHGQMVELKEQNDVIAVADRLFICTDNRDWLCVRDVFAPEVLFDMTSLAGGRPETRTPAQITDAWDQGLKSLKAIHHQAGNYQTAIKGNEADLFCYGIAFHYLPNPTNQNTRTFVGSYNFHLVKGASGWKIDRFKYNLKFIDGNKDLEGSAAKGS
ncbi:MAG TPA: nuclear transport factor 2 family protein [Nitrospirota bacterium]|nr:nuclear transport factor 2 family protein [Nitrospirota bacterium]